MQTEQHDSNGTAMFLMLLFMAILIGLFAGWQDLNLLGLLALLILCGIVFVFGAATYKLSKESE